MAEAAFGVELRRSRQAAALSLRQLAARVGYDHSYLSQVERGQRPGSAHLAQLCDRALGTGSALAAAYERFRPRQPAAVAATGQDGPSHAAASSDAVDRAPAQVAAAAPAAPGQLTAAGPDPLEATRHGLAACIGEVQDVDEWSTVVADHARDYLTAAPMELLRDIAADLELLRASAGASAASAALLAVPAARLSLLMAITLGDLGRTRAAARWWRTTRRAAERSGDASTRSLVLSLETLCRLPQRGVADELVGLSEQALELDGRPAAAARALAGKSYALAELGRASEARRVLDDFCATMSDAPAAVPSDASLFNWAAYKAPCVESRTRTALGDTAQAYAAQDRALQLTPAEHRSELAELELQRAHCLVQDKEVAAGLATAMRVLVELPDQWHTEFLYDAAGRVLSAVPPEDLARPVIRDYRALLLRRPYQPGESRTPGGGSSRGTAQR